jgi:hypothetical protein
MNRLIEAADPERTDFKRKLNKWMKDATLWLKRATGLTWTASKYNDSLFSRDTVNFRVDQEGPAPRFQVEFGFKPSSQRQGATGPYTMGATVSVRVQSDQYQKDRASFHRYVDEMSIPEAMDVGKVLDPVKMEIARYVDKNDKSAEYDRLLDDLTGMQSEAEETAKDAEADAEVIKRMVALLKQTPGRLPPNLYRDLMTPYGALRRHSSSYGTFQQNLSRFTGQSRY